MVVTLKITSSSKRTIMSRLLLFFCAALAWGGTAVGQQWPTVWHANTVWQDNPNLENQDAAASVADSAEFNTVGSTSNMLVGAIGWDVNSPAFDNIGQNAPYWIWGSNAAANQ